METFGHSNYIAYVDESGDHSLDSIDEAFPIFVLAFCVFPKPSYPDVSKKVQAFKFANFGHDMIVLHERDIRKQKGQFSFLANRKKRDIFMGELSGIIDSSDFIIISSVIRKKLHVNRYRYPTDPYELSMQFCLERLYSFLKEKGQHELITHVVVECRGAKEDKDLELAFRRVCDKDNRGRISFPFKLVFAHKQANSCGLQLADLVARPIGRKIINPAEENRAYNILERKFYTGTGGILHGNGLKVFP